MPITAVSAATAVTAMTEQSRPRLFRINNHPSLPDVSCCSYQGPLAPPHHRRGFYNIPTGRFCWWCNTMASSHHQDFYSSFPLGSWNRKVGKKSLWWKPSKGYEQQGNVPCCLIYCGIYWRITLLVIYWCHLLDEELQCTGVLGALNQTPAWMMDELRVCMACSALRPRAAQQKHRVKESSPKQIACL